MRSILLLAPRDWPQQVRRGIVTGLAFVAVIWVTRCDMAKKQDAWQAERAAILIRNEEVTKQARKDSALVESHAKANALLVSEISHLQARIAARSADRRTAIAVAQGKPYVAPDSATCNAYLALAASAQADADTLDHALTTARGIIVNQTADIARLQGSNAALLSLNDSLVHLAKTAPIKPKLLGFIPLPSRTASFIAGGVLGIAGAYAVLK